MLLSLKEMPNEQRRLVGVCMALGGSLILLLVKMI
jgi:uncharacterized protein YjeT (DUF2065 family)